MPAIYLHLKITFQKLFNCNSKDCLAKNHLTSQIKTILQTTCSPYFYSCYLEKKSKKNCFALLFFKNLSTTTYNITDMTAKRSLASP